METYRKEIENKRSKGKKKETSLKRKESIKRKTGQPKNKKNKKR